MWPKIKKNHWFIFSNFHFKNIDAIFVEGREQVIVGVFEQWKLVYKTMTLKSKSMTIPERPLGEWQVSEIQNS